ncbi:hypothetical protein ACEWY4_017393 [Coilia grayii]|uniref:Polymeric immunoglobulin receptor n=1 Tax=Coilia grayii TaxID=363190 RepID=A0ABD1JHT5_9TELE
MGEAAHVTCRYPEKYANSSKALCKTTTDCDATVLASRRGLQGVRSLLSDRPSQSFFTVNLTRLTGGDGGEYRCAVLLSPTNLRLLATVHLQMVNITGYTGDSVTVVCPYNNKTSKDNVKFFCQGQDPIECVERGVKVASHFPGLSHFTLREDAMSDLFTVTIDGLTAEDSGIYWCGEHSGEYYFTSAVLLGVHDSVRNNSAKAQTPDGNTMELDSVYEYMNPVTDQQETLPQSFGTEPQYEFVTDHSMCDMSSNNSEQTLKPHTACICKDPEKITASSGGSVNIKCSYDRRFLQRNKYFCKTIGDTGCDILVSNEDTRQPVSPRLNLADQQQDSSFIVSITNLSAEDAGVYWCAAGGSSPSAGPELLTEVHIHVSPVYADEDNEATFKCPYAKGYQNNSKLLCKGECNSRCKDILIKTEGQSHSKTGRFSVYDNATARVFSVTIANLTAEDSGKFWCGVRTGVSDVCTEQQLLVRDVVKGAEGGSVNITCKYKKEKGRPNFLYFCREKDTAKCGIESSLVTSTAPNQGRYVLDEDNHYKHTKKDYEVFSVTITGLTTGDSGIYWCGRSGEERLTVVKLKVIKGNMSSTDGTAHMSLSVMAIGVTAGGILLLSLFAIIIVLRRRKASTAQENSSPTNRNPDPNPIQLGQVYQSLNPATVQHNSVYQNLNPNPSQRQGRDPGQESPHDPVYQSLDPHTMAEMLLLLLLMVTAIGLIPGECNRDFIRITGQLGASLNITCGYPEEYTNDSKVFCVTMGNACGTLVSLKADEEEAKRGRFSLVYDKEERTLRVSIDGLMENETALYWCGARRGLFTDILHVTPVIGHVGGSVKFRCPYGRELEPNPKYFLREDRFHDTSLQTENTLIRSKQGNILVTHGRFSLYDNTTSRVFTVTISNLTAEDSGKYWCVVERNATLNSIPTEHLLNVEGGRGPILTNRKWAGQKEDKVSDPYHIDTIYTEATFPRATHEDPLYSLVQLPRQDPTENIYSLLQLPRNTASELSDSCCGSEAHEGSSSFPIGQGDKCFSSPIGNECKGSSPIGNAGLSCPTGNTYEGSCPIGNASEGSSTCTAEVHGGSSTPVGNVLEGSFTPIGNGHDSSNPIGNAHDSSTSIGNAHDSSSPIANASEGSSTPIGNVHEGSFTPIGNIQEGSSSPISEVHGDSSSTSDTQEGSSPIANECKGSFPTGNAGLSWPTGNTYEGSSTSTAEVHGGTMAIGNVYEGKLVQGLLGASGLGLVEDLLINYVPVAWDWYRTAACQWPGTGTGPAVCQWAGTGGPAACQWAGTGTRLLCAIGLGLVQGLLHASGLGLVQDLLICWVPVTWDWYRTCSYAVCQWPGTDIQ